MVIIFLIKSIFVCVWVFVCFILGTVCLADSDKRIIKRVICLSSYIRKSTRVTKIKRLDSADFIYNKIY